MIINYNNLFPLAIFVNHQSPICYETVCLYLLLGSELNVKVSINTFPLLVLVSAITRGGSHVYTEQFLGQGDSELLTGQAPLHLEQNCVSLCFGLKGVNNITLMR